MVKLVGPVMSLSASGDFGKTINFFYSKYGPVARKKLKYKPPYGNVWNVNKAFFTAASDRWMSLSDIQKNAWKIYFIEICDTARDLFMGAQIEAWNLSPLNDLTWPSVSLKDIVWPEYEVWHSLTKQEWYPQSGFKSVTYEEFQICSMRWYNTDSWISCDESSFLKETIMPYTKFTEAEITKTYFWIRPRRLDGSLGPFHRLWKIGIGYWEY